MKRMRWLVFFAIIEMGVLSLGLAAGQSSMNVIGVVDISSAKVLEPGVL